MIRTSIFGDNEAKILRMAQQTNRSVTELNNIIIAAIDELEFSQMVVVKFREEVNSAVLKPAAKKKHFRKESNWKFQL